MDKLDLFASIGPEIATVDQAMHQDLRSLERKELVPDTLLKVLEHALFNGGKRIRPLLCILAARLCGHHGKEVYPLAIAFEYLHVATLLHDDVIDHADTRRSRPTANMLFGLTPAILAGDFLHAHSMFLVGTLGGKLCLELLCNATRAMVSGEFLQLENTQNFNQSEKDYFAVINGKTALFIGAVCEIGGIFGGADAMERAGLKTYGANLGKAFQMQDDLLDYLGDQEKTGKAVGNDFCERKMTLPLLHALGRASKSEQDFLLGLLKGKKSARVANLEEAREIIRKNSGFEYTRELAKKLIDDAVASLAVFTSARNKPVLETLAALAHYTVTREK